MSACDACLRRTELIAAVAPRLDVEWRRRSAPAGVLALPDDALLALDPTGCAARGYAAFAAAGARDRAQRAGLALVCRCDAAYPAGLHELADAPAVLHVAGRPEALAAAGAVAIVGARRGTPYGIEVARALGRSLAGAGVPVVSGMALGIDSAAHVGALDPPDAPAPVAVLAGGADVPYPASRRRLYGRLVERGCVVSELPPGFSAFRWCFVARNRIIAALAALTVVVEAAERSGSLTTADFAAQVGRPVLAVPGPITSRFSAGTNGLIASGAGVVRGARDVLDQLRGPAPPGAAHAPPPAVPIEPRLRRLLDAVERGLGSLAELVTADAGGAEVLRDLTDLELRGLVRRDFGGRYVRTLGDDGPGLP